MIVSRLHKDDVRRFIAFTFVASACWVAPAALAAPTNQLDFLPESVTSRQSSFDDKLKTAKDPFFPNSARRVVKTNAATSASAPPPITQLALKGFFVNRKGERLVTINDKDFAAGDEAEVTVPSGKIRVRCLDIKNRTVTIMIEGDTQQRELRWQDGL
jgi:hypothetical protein